MTDGEKAEFINEMTEKIYCWLANEKPKIKQAIKEGLEKGLTEGRKDRNCVNCSNHGKQLEVMKLEKENTELKAQIEKMKNMYNCENSQQMNGEFFCPFFDFYGSMTCCNCNKWELAEKE